MRRVPRDPTIADRARQETSIDTDVSVEHRRFRPGRSWRSFPRRRLSSILLAALVSVMTIDADTRQWPAPAADQTRTNFQSMFARGYYPGRTGQLMIVPREGVVITRNDPAVPFMHGSPWSYDTAIPLFFVGAQVKAGSYSIAARQQDVAPTLAAALGTAMPPTATGHSLPIFVSGAPRPRAVALVVLDGMRVDYFADYAAEMPTLTRLREQSAWMATTRIDYLPTNTAVGHSTIATGTDPRVHGITGNNLYDHVNHRRRDSLAGVTPADLMALTLSDVWQLENRGRPVVITLGSSVPAATALAGHGACQVNGVPMQAAAYDEKAGRWFTNANCFLPIDSIKDLTADRVWPADGLWMKHTINTPSEVRRSALWPKFEADTLIRLIETSAIGADEVADLVLLNLKAADYVGHKYGPASSELRATLAELDRQLARILAAIESKVGSNYLLAITADHGMPGEPPAQGRRYASQTVDALHARFDPQEKTLVPYYEPENAQIFVDTARLATLRLTLDDLKTFLESQPYVFAAFTEDEIRRVARR
jgi:hypothetical protein